jgi:hypothetical protein
MFVKTRSDFDILLAQINNDEFRNNSIRIYPIPKDEIFNDTDLKKLENAINNNQWCRENLICINLDSNGRSFCITPEFDCPALQTLNLYSNSFYSFPQLAHMPNLIELDLHGLNISRVPNLNGYNSLRLLRLLWNRLRVPANVVGCANLRSYFILSGNSFTWLGKYALLVMKNNRPELVIDGAREGEFARDFAGAHEYTGDISDFVDNYVIPEYFFEQQVGAVVDLMHETYFNRIEILRKQDGPNTYTTYNKKYRKSLPKNLAAMKEDYMQQKLELFTLIDAIVKKNINISFDVIKEQVAKFTIDLEAHQQFFLDELDHDFSTLKDIFIATNKPHHAEDIDAFVAKNQSKFKDVFDIEKKLFEDAYKYFNCVTDDPVLEIRTLYP